MSVWSKLGPFDAMAEFSDGFRCITMDLRNAPSGQSTGPLEVDRPWDAYADDQLGLMDHLGVREFLVLGCCIGGPFIMNLLKRAPGRVVAAVLCQPSGHRPENPDVFWNNNQSTWGPALRAQRPEITPAMIDAFLTKMYRSDPDFVFTVSRDFARACETPVLVMPDDVAAHPWAISMALYKLLPNAEVTIYPWKDSAEHLAQAVEQVRAFLKAHAPALAGR
jgi:pimeloyl-ACP methyl ester carboxylesterase